MNDMGMDMSLQQMDMNTVMYPEITGENKPKKSEHSDHSNHTMPSNDIVTLNYAMLKSPTKTTLPSGLGAEKSALHLAPLTEGAAGPAFNFPKASFTALPGLVFCNDSSKLLNIASAFLISVLGSFNTP